MKGFRTAVAVASLAFGWLAGCNDNNTSIQYNTGATLLNISPTGLSAGGTDFLLTVNASQFNGFNSTTVIQWNNSKLPTTFVDVTTLTATVPASLLAKPGVAYVNTLTSQSGSGQNGLSNTLAFNIYGAPNPVPTITSISPDTAPACGTSCGNASLNITVSGTNFLSTSNNGGSLVTFQDRLTTQQQPTALTISSISDSEIKATIPGAYLANDDIGLIQVLNPQNGLCTKPACLPLVGGGPSNTMVFTIGAGLAPAIAEETPAISQDGRYVAYASQQNQVNQILLKDTCVGVANGCTANTRVISATADGTPGNADSHNAVITPDGRYVAFSSAATNLVEGAPAGRQIFLRDTCIGADNSCKPSTTLISKDADGALNGTESILPSINTTGRYVAFVAITPSANSARVAGPPPNLAASPNSGLRQVFVRDTCLGEANCTPKTTRISMSPGDAPGNGAKPAGPAISGQAKQIALSDGKTATLLTPTVKVDDNVVVAVPKDQ
jgi:IPT/TIG domain/WD40-like Beta Propeller Repeat